MNFLLFSQYFFGIEYLPSVTVQDRQKYQTHGKMYKYLHQHNMICLITPLNFQIFLAKLCASL